MAAATPRLPALPRVKVFRNRGRSLLNPVDEVGRVRVEQREQRDGGQRTDDVALRGVGPVSYTHLTLPTSDLV